jgi:hypothetical protein
LPKGTGAAARFPRSRVLLLSLASPLISTKEKKGSENMGEVFKRTTTKTEEQVLKELRKIDWGKLTVVKKNGEIVMISPTTDIKTSRD